MATKLQQRMELIEFMGDEAVSGEVIKRFVMRKGWNAWQVSILLSQMVGSGLLEVMGVWKETAGNTYRKTYAATERGREYAANAGNDESWDESARRIDLARTLIGRLGVKPVRVGVGWFDDHDKKWALRTALAAGWVQVQVVLTDEGREAQVDGRG